MKGYTRDKEIKCKMEMCKRNSSASYREPRKNVLKNNLLLLWTIFLCFFIGLFHYLVIFPQMTWHSAHSDDDVLTFRTGLEKRYTEVVVRSSSLKLGSQNFANFTGKHLCWSLFLLKLQGWSPATFFLLISCGGCFWW